MRLIRNLKLYRELFVHTMFVESFFAVNSGEFDESTVQEVVTELDSRNSES